MAGQKERFMNAKAAQVIVNGYLKGAFDVLDAMLSRSFAYSSAAPEPWDSNRISAALAERPVALQGRIKNNLGSVALLLTIDDAARIASVILDRPFASKPALDDEERGMLREVAEPALGGGVTNLMESFGRTVEQFERVEVVDSGVANAADLGALLGAEPTGVTFEFNGDDFAGKAAFLYSGSLEDLVPKNLMEEAPPAGPQISPAEMADILSGFKAEEAAPKAETRLAPENLDLVLDIRLQATARLGRVEMPISEILSLGPGSIIEIGHAVEEPIELLVNNKPVARGDVVVVDEKFGLRITEIISPKARIESLR
jgi:flagellar motor switch protein FliN/FliY